MRSASYGPAMGTSGSIEITKVIELPIEGKDVLIVEDIIESGHTLEFLKDRIALSNPRSIQRIGEVMLQSRCSLHRRDINHTPDLWGFFGIPSPLPCSLHGWLFLR